MKANALLLRKRLCLELADEISELFGTSRVSLEEIAQTIDLRLPQTYEEAEAEYEEQRKLDEQPCPKSDKPSRLTGLCNALNLKKEEFGIKAIMDAATERLELVNRYFGKVDLDTLRKAFEATRTGPL